MSTSVCVCERVICSFRGSLPHGLSLEIGETVQILERCEETRVGGRMLVLKGHKERSFCLLPLFMASD
ncbi:dedicator of cytokinesis protein 3 isoform X1 [Tachysurus ichikawai]